MGYFVKVIAFCPLAFTTGCGFGAALGAAVPGGWAAWRVGVVFGLAVAAAVAIFTAIEHFDS